MKRRLEVPGQVLLLPLQPCFTLPFGCLAKADGQMVEISYCLGPGSAKLSRLARATYLALLQAACARPGKQLRFDLCDLGEAVGHRATGDLEQALLELTGLWLDYHWHEHRRIMTCLIAEYHGQAHGRAVVVWSSYVRPALDDAEFRQAVWAIRLDGGRATGE